MSAQATIQLLVLERRDAVANMARFYVLSLEETLFGDTALVREWGRLGHQGRRRLDLFEARAQASEALGTWLERKTRRGYVSVRSERETDLVSNQSFQPSRLTRAVPVSRSGQGRAA